MPTASDDRVGQTIGGYRVVRELGRGGMGAVYEAVQERLGRRVALKLLHPDLATDDGLVARFRREAEAAAQLGHPNIVQVTDFGRADDGSMFLVMDYLSGTSLGGLVSAEGRLPPARVAWIVWQVLAALSAAHRAGIVHRDLKPDNVMLVEVAGVGDVVKLLDFGIAKLARAGDVGLTATGMVLGTPSYMAPEQARGAEVDARTDVYAAGALAYEALSARQPYEGKSYNALIAAILMDSPTPLAGLRPELDPALVAIVERAMARDPAARFQTADDMAAALEPFVTQSLPKAGARASIPRDAGAISLAPTLASTPVVAPAPAPAPSPSAPPRARVGLIAVALLVAGGLVAGAVVMTKTEPDRSWAPPPASMHVAPAIAAGADALAAVPSAPVDASADATATSPDASSAVPTKRAPTRASVIAFRGWNPNGLYDSAAMHAALDPIAPAVSRCYRAGPPLDTDFRLDVAADGTVTHAGTYGNVHGPESPRACTARVLGQVHFGAPTRTAAAGTVDVWFGEVR